MTGAQQAMLHASEAAEHCGVETVTIRQWVAQGYLEPINPGGRPPLYLRAALDRCEQARQEQRGKNTPQSDDVSTYRPIGL